MRQYQYPVTGNRTEYLELTSSDKFITVLNNSDYTVNIYKERGINSSNLLMKIPIYTGITIPLEKTSIITIEMTGSSQAQISIVLSEENLNVNQNFITPSGYTNVSIVSPLPQGGNNIGKVDVNSIPELPPGSNNIGKVDVNSLPALPTGTNNIGKVDVNSIPDITGKAITPVKITTSAGVDYTVKPTPGKIIRINTALTDLLIKDSTTEIWKNGGDFSMAPLQCNTSIVLNSATGGDVYIQFI